MFLFGAVPLAFLAYASLRPGRHEIRVLDEALGCKRICIGLMACASGCSDALELDFRGFEDGPYEVEVEQLGLRERWACRRVYFAVQKHVRTTIKLTEGTAGQLQLSWIDTDRPNSSRYEPCRRLP